MRSSENGDSCAHPVRPPNPNNCLIRGRRDCRTVELGKSVVIEKGVKGVFPVMDGDDGELVIGEEEVQVSFRFIGPSSE